MSKIEKKASLSILCTTMVLSLAVLVAPKAQAATDVSLSFSPSATNVTAGENFTVDIMVFPGTHQVSNADLSLTFDAAKLNLTSITNVASLFSVPQISTIGSGTASYSAGTAFGTNVTAAGIAPATTALYATLHFTAITASSSTVAISSNTAFYADDDPGVNQLSSTNVSTVVTVNAASELPPVTTDVAAPVLSNGIPAGKLSSSTNSVNLSLITDENATCKYATSADTAYDAMPNTFSSTGQTSHSSSITGLDDDKSYTYYVKCQDASLNKNSFDYAISFSINEKESSSDKDKKEKKPKRKVTVSKSKVSRGDTLIERGSGFSKKAEVWLYFSKAGGSYHAPMKIKTSSSGKFVIHYKVNKTAGKYNWYAVDKKTGKKSKLSVFSVR